MTEIKQIRPKTGLQWVAVALGHERQVLVDRDFGSPFDNAARAMFAEQMQDAIRVLLETSDARAICPSALAGDGLDEAGEAL